MTILTIYIYWLYIYIYICLCTGWLILIECVCVDSVDMYFDFYCCFQTMMDTTYDSKLTPLKTYPGTPQSWCLRLFHMCPMAGEVWPSKATLWDDHGSFMLFPCCFHIANGDFWLSQYQPPGHLWPVRILPADSHLIAQMCHDIEPHAPLTALRESFHAMRRDATTVAATAGLFGPRWSDDKRRLFGNRTVGGCWWQIADGWIGL